jgi:prepilin-type N-terminal cleavage/methylation domain-containing protein
LDKSGILKENNKMSTKKHKAGFTIVELLISLAITVLLLTAVAIAVNASAMNYKENKSIFDTVNSARQALYRITTQLRTADSVDPNTADNLCSFFQSASNDFMTYSYDSSDNTLYLINNSISESYTLCENVTAMTFTKNSAVVDDLTIVKSVQITMTVSDGNITQNFSAAAVIRRNLE